MDFSFCQFPDQPCLDRTEQHFPILRFFSGTFYMIQDPFQFRSGKIGINDQSCLLSDLICQPLFFQSVTILGSSSALPYDCRTDRFSGCPVPYDNRLSLIRNSNCCNIFRFGTDLAHCLYRNSKLCGPYLVRIVLHPARFWKILCKFLLCKTLDLTLFIK